MPTSDLSVRQDGRVILNLPGHKPVTLGRIDGDIFYTPRDPEIHLLRKLNAFGFNASLVRSGWFHTIAVQLPFGQELRTSCEHLLANGIYKNFSKRGFELQVFLRVDEFSSSCSDRKDVAQSDSSKETTEQLDLFGEASQ